MLNLGWAQMEVNHAAWSRQHQQQTQPQQQQQQQQVSLRLSLTPPLLAMLTSWTSKPCWRA